jgi:hypothetical protein
VTPWYNEEMSLVHRKPVPKGYDEFIAERDARRIDGTEGTGHLGAKVAKLMAKLLACAHFVEQILSGSLAHSVS